MISDIEGQSAITEGWPPCLAERASIYPGRWAGIVMLLVSGASGCASPKIVRPEVHQGAPIATVLVYREPAFNSGLAALQFGEGGKTYLSLDNAQFGELHLAPGVHEFTVGAPATKDFTLDVELTAGQTTCIRARADPANYAKILIPILMNVTNAFEMEVVSCPKAEDLANYERYGGVTP